MAPAGGPVGSASKLAANPRAAQHREAQRIDGARSAEVEAHTGAADHDQRQAACDPVVPKAIESMPRACVRQQVKHDQIGPTRVCLPHSVVHSAGRYDREALLLKRLGERQARVRLVRDEQDGRPILECDRPRQLAEEAGVGDPVALLIEIVPGPDRSCSGRVGGLPSSRDPSSNRRALGASGLLVPSGSRSPSCAHSASPT